MNTVKYFSKNWKQSIHAPPGKTVLLCLVLCIHFIFLNKSFTQTVTKHLYLSSPGQILDRIDPVNTGDTSTDSSSTLGEILIVNPSTAVAFWHENGVQQPQYKIYDGSIFGPELSAPSVSGNTAGSIISVQSPTDDNEAFVVEITNNSDIHILRWNGSNFISEPFNPVSNTVNDFKMNGAQIAYSPNGNAMFVWDDNATDDILHYRTWNGITKTWSAALTYTLTSGVNNKPVANMKLAADPNSNEMVFAYIDSDNDDYGLVWNGTSWNNHLEFNNVNSLSYRDIGVAYESISGDAICTYAKNDIPGIIYYRIWNGSSWSAENSTAYPVGPNGSVEFVKLASDPNSNKIAIAVTTTGNDTWFGIWDGSTWGNKISILGNVDQTNNALADVAFEYTSGDIMAVTWDRNFTSLRYHTYSAGAWSALTVGPNFSSIPRELELYPDNASGSNKIRVFVNDQGQNAYTVLWNGSTWSPVALHETSTGIDGSNSGEPMTTFWTKSETWTRDTSVNFVQDPVMCSNLNIVSGDSIRVRTYINILNGSLVNGQTYDISAILKRGNTTFATLNNALYNSGNGGSFYWAIPSTNTTVSANDSITLQIRINTFPSSVRFKIIFDSNTRPSKISLPVSTYIDQNSIAIYNAPYPGGSLLANIPSTSTVYIRTTATNPFGTYDITGDSIRITDPFNNISNVLATEVNASGCTKTYEYVWNTPATTGRYILRGKALAGYEGTVSDTLSTLFYLCSPALSHTHTNVSCFGGTNGSIDLTVNGGAPPISYDWSNDGSENPDNDNQDLTGLSVGIYVVTVTDAGGCSSTASVIVTQPTTLNRNATITNVSCNGFSNGAIDLSVTGGTAPYTYAWSNGQTSQDIMNIGANTYVVTISDANGCTSTLSSVVTQPAVLSVFYDTVSVSCFASGAINITTIGGTPPYNFDWADLSGTQNSEDRTGLAGGSYSLTITDVNGCTRTQSIQLGIPSCNNSTTVCQSETASVFFVIPDPMVDNYIWTVPPGAIITNGQGTSQIQLNLTGSIPGSYQVCAKSVNICGESANTCLNVHIRAVTPVASAGVACMGQTLQLTANGGVAYSWAGPSGFTSSSPNPVIANLSAANNGTYTVTVTDNKGCFATTTVNVTVRPNPTASVVITDASCGANNGAINLSPAGGTPAYTYMWNNGAISQDLSGLYAGVYYVTVTDAFGCKAISNNAVVDVDVDVSLVVTDSIDCYGGSNGDINLIILSGNAPFSYQWSNGVTTQDLTNVPAGLYKVAITDVNGCKGNGVISLTQPNNLVIDHVKINVGCNGQNTGSINTSITGGTPPYSYNWSGGQTSQDISNLTAGNYTLTVTDSKLCTGTATIYISQPASALSATTLITNINCNGAANGVIIVDVFGGTQPYLFDWADIAGNNNPKDRTDLGPGNYTVTITDANGCSVVRAASITQPTVLNPGFTKLDASCFAAQDGSIILTVSGGTIPYYYSWSNGEDSQVITSLSAGNYMVTVSDNNNCSNTLSVTITQPTPLVASAIEFSTLCNGASNGGIDLTVNGGTPGYTYNWSNGAFTQDIYGIAEGNYAVTVTDINSCTTETAVIVTSPSSLNVSGAMTNLLCNGALNGAIDITASGGTPPYNYDWSDIPGANNTADRNALASGNYTLTVTDVNGCTLTNVYTITSPSAISLSMSNTNLSCNGSNNGSINLNISGGVSPFSYLWSDGFVAKDRSGLSPGSYTVTVTDANNCVAQLTSAPITQPAILSISTLITQVNCYEGNNGSITAIPAGGTPPFSYAWSNAAFTQTNSNLSSGIYRVTVTDNNNCIAVASRTITQPAEPIVMYAVPISSSCNGPNGSIDLTVVGGQAPYTYAWSNGYAAQDPAGLLPATYTVTVTDALNCQRSQSFILTAAAPLTTTVSAFQRSCNYQDGSAFAVHSGGMPPYTYAWSNGANTQSIFNLNTGSYSVTVTEKNGCRAIASGNVGIPSCLPPDARNDYYKTPYNTPILNGTVAPLQPQNPGYDSDADHLLSQLSFTPMTTPLISQGDIEWDPTTNGSFNFYPAPGYIGEFSVLYKVCDPTDLCDTARLFIKVGNPQIGLSKAVAAPSIDNGNGTFNISYIIKVKNTGDVNITNIQSTDNLATTFAGTSGFTLSNVSSAKFSINPSYNGTTNINLLTGTDNLIAGDSGTISINLVIRPGNNYGTYYNTTNGSGRDPNGDLVNDVSQNGNNVDPDNDGNPGNNSETTPLALPRINLTKVGVIDMAIVPPNDVVNPGDRVNYSFVVCNNGRIPLTNITITDTLVPVNGAPIPTLAIGACNSTQFTAAYSIKQIDIDSGRIINFATARGFDQNGNPVTDVSDDPNDFTNSDPDGDGDPDDPTVTSVKQVPKIGLAKKIVSTTNNLDGTFTSRFELIIRNNGNVTLGDIKLTDNLMNEFGTYRSQTPIAPGEYTVINFSIAQNSVNPLSLNPLFNGSSDQSVLRVTSGGSMASNETVKINYSLRFVPQKYEYLNQGIVTGDLPINDDPVSFPDNDPDDATDISDTGINATNDVAQGGHNPGEPGDRGTTDDATWLGVPAAELKGTVWDDTNGNGIQDIGEKGLANVEAWLFECNDNLVTKDTTDASGNYLFDYIIAPKNYYVVFKPGNLSTEYGFTAMNAGSNDDLDSDVDSFGYGACISLAESERDSTYDAGLVRFASTGDFSWKDKNGNGIQDVGEEGMKDVKVSLYKKSNNQMMRTTTTDINGYYYFDQLMPDDYYIKFEPSTNLSPTNANMTADNKDSDIDNSNGLNTTATFHLAPGQDDMGCDGGFYGCTTISGDVWYDEDKDGIYDWVEKGINGLYVYIIDVSTGKVVSTIKTATKPGTPSDDGYYQSGCLKQGNYYVEFERPGHLGASLPYQGNDPNKDSDITHENGINTTRIVIIANGISISNISGGFQTKSMAGDKVWLDQNFNGLQDQGEQPLQGIEVAAYNYKGIKVSESVTGTDGRFLLDGLTAGDFYLKFNVGQKYAFTKAHAGIDELDSDVDGTFGFGSTKMYQIYSGETRPTIDAGLVSQVLALEWLSFDGKHNGNFVELDWNTGVETDNLHFIIERKHESENQFRNLDTVAAHSNPALTLHQYSYDDFDGYLPGVYYYRIKQVDKNGMYAYSQTIAVHSKNKEEDIIISVYPNPVKDLLKIECWLPEVSKIEITVMDNYGKKILNLIDNQEKSRGTLSEVFDSRELTSGQYYLQIKTPKGIIHKKFTVIK